jgi:hypothetical protein
MFGFFKNKHKNKHEFVQDQSPFKTNCEFYDFFMAHKHLSNVQILQIIYGELKYNGRHRAVDVMDLIITTREAVAA